MNKAQRQPYLALTTVPFPIEDGEKYHCSICEFKPYQCVPKCKFCEWPPRVTFASMCSFCRFAEWSGDCEDSQAECKHPLPVVNGDQAELVSEGEGEDCWGFRPQVAVEVAADMVGIWLQGQEVEEKSIPTLAKGRRSYERTI